MAALAPTLHPDGVLVNVIGQVSMPTEGPLGDALKTRLERWRGRTRILITAQEDEQGRITAPQKVRDRGDALIYRYGLRFDFDDCLPIRFVRHTRDGKPDFTAVSCATKPRERDDPEHERQELRANSIFALLESQCPRVFAPVPMVSDYDGEKWQRRYVNTDARLVVSHKDGVFIDHFRLLPIGHLGTIEDVAAGRGRNACSVWRDEMFK